MTALIAYGPIVFLALLALVAWVRDRFRSTPSVAEMVDQALDSGDALDLAQAAGVVAGSDLDGSHDNLDVDQFRWAEEVIWLTEQYEADEVPIIPGRLPGEGR